MASRCHGGVCLCGDPRVLDVMLRAAEAATREPRIFEGNNHFRQCSGLSHGGVIGQHGGPEDLLHAAGAPGCRRLGGREGAYVCTSPEHLGTRC